MKLWGEEEDNGGKITNVLELIALCGMEEVKVAVKGVGGLYFNKVLLWWELIIYHLGFGEESLRDVCSEMNFFLPQSFQSLWGLPKKGFPDLIQDVHSYLFQTDKQHICVSQILCGVYMSKNTFIVYLKLKLAFCVFIC